MASGKQFVLDVLDALPDDCTLEEIQYQLYVRSSVAEGERAADDGRVVPHDKAMRDAAKWLDR